MVAPWREARAVVRPFARRCVFVIGPARSGTTILQNALNTSRDIYLLGEPGFETDPGTSGFAARYHARQAAVANMENKSTALPPLLEDDPPWWIWLRALADHHHRVGAKIAINPGDDPAHARLLMFYGQVFYDSSYIFTFRDPLAAASSRQLLNTLSGVDAMPWQDLFANILSVIGLFVRMARLFPDVRAVLHEDMGAPVLANLGTALGCDVSAGAVLYRPSQVRTYAIEDVPQAALPHCRYALAAYALLREVLVEAPALTQLNQNSGNIDPDHRTALGRLAILLDPTSLTKLE